MVDKHSEQRKFWVKVAPSSTGCWLWTGGTRDNNYGSFAVINKKGNWSKVCAHRFAYQMEVGSIPEGFEVDHLCRVRNCVRPEHLEAVTIAENRRRRDLQIVFNVPTDYKELPFVPNKPLPKPKPDRTKFCAKGHEFAVTGKTINGFSADGKRRLTCAVCRLTQYAKKKKNNAAADRTHCPKGHEYIGENLISKIKYKNGRPYNARECRTCAYARNNAARKRKVADTAIGSLASIRTHRV